jgi:hypothetical protein
MWWRKVRSSRFWTFDQAAFRRLPKPAVGRSSQVSAANFDKMARAPRSLLVRQVEINLCALDVANSRQRKGPRLPCERSLTPTACGLSVKLRLGYADGTLGRQRFASGHLDSESGTNASSAGMVLTSL